MEILTKMSEIEATAGQEQLPNSTRRPIGWLTTACMVALLAGYAIFLAHFYAPAISHPDANGYWAQGTLIAETGRATFRPESPTQYIGMHWLVTDSGLYVSRYSPGLPLVIALITRLFGPEASVLLNPILAVLTLLGVFLLMRFIAGPGWGILAAASLGINPIFNSHALSSISHMSVAALLVWGVYLLVCWAKHGRLIEAFGAGLLLGCIPAVRYPEALFGLGVAVFLLWHWRVRQRIWLHGLVAVAGALLPTIPLMIRNQLTFGAFWRTAYALTHEQTGFGWDYFQQHWFQYVQSLLSEGMGALLPLALLGIALMITLPPREQEKNPDAPQAGLVRPFGVLMALLTAPTILLYMAYYWDGMGGTGEGLRFLLPLFPLFAVTAIWTLRLLTERMGRAPRLTAVSVILFVYALWAVPTSLQNCRMLAYQQQILARTTTALRANVPAGSVIMSSQNLLQHLDFIRAWRLTDMTPGARGGARGGFQQAADDDTPRPTQANRLRERTARYEGLSGRELEQAVAEDIQSWAGDKDIWFVGSETQLENMAGAYFNQQSFEIVARVDLPDPPPQSNLMGRRGMFGMRGMPGAGNARRPGGGARTPDAGAPPQPPDRGGAPGTNRPPPPGGPQGMGGGRPMGGPPGMGGGMGMGSFQGEKQLVIARWTGGDSAELAR